MDMKTNDEIITEDQAWLQKAAALVNKVIVQDGTIARLEKSVENLAGILKQKDGELEQLRSKQPEHDPEEMLRLLRQFHWVVTSWEGYIGRGLSTILVDTCTEFRKYVPKDFGAETPETPGE